MSTTATGWVDVPDMAGSLATAANADLEVTFSAEAFTSGVRMFVRALIDGQPADPSDVVFARGDFGGTRTFTFTKRDVTAGARPTNRPRAISTGTGRAPRVGSPP